MKNGWNFKFVSFPPFCAGKRSMTISPAKSLPAAARTNGNVDLKIEALGKKELSMNGKRKRLDRTVFFALAIATLILGSLTLPAAAKVFDCPADGQLAQGGDADLDLKVSGLCKVTGTPKSPRKSLLYVFRNVNIIGGGNLDFIDGQDIDFYAESILIENKGKLVAGSPNTAAAFKSRLTFHLWGAKTDDGIECKSPLQKGAPCGIPDELWDANPGMAEHMEMTMKMPPDLPKNKECKHVAGYGDLLPGDDCFYRYEVQDDQDIKNGKQAYFGHKVLAVSFGGALKLYGAKGATYQANTACDPKVPSNECNPANTGTSWRRLTGISDGGKTLTLSAGANPVDWKKDDHVVVTTTDYLPSHSEERVLSADAKNGKVELTSALTYMHNASVYPLPTALPNDIGPQDDPNVPGIKRAVDTRAAVALLTRNIQVVSEGSKPEPDATADTFPPTPGNFYGGHTIVRQGFASYQVQGVEFYRLGQGGQLGRYPVHFHMARRTPQRTDPRKLAPLNYLKDCSIHDSMTRWVTIHATQGMYVARNVGFKSIGHGFYFEDATEINNKLYANIGISALAAIKNAKQNPRQVPGILADTSTDNSAADAMPYRSDFNHPTTFWIMNGWNDFQYNMAVGAATCGACYWWLPAADSGPSQYEWWDGYASEQIWDPQGNTDKDTSNFSNAGVTPLKSFVGNSCVSAMSSFQTVGSTAECIGVPAQGGGGLAAVPSTAPKAPTDVTKFSLYYPTITALRNPTICAEADDPSKSVQCGNTKGNAPPPNCDNKTGHGCAATVLDHYTTSFNWAQTNFSAVWLRPKWYLVSNSAITDIQTGGLNFVTGGGYTRSDVPLGYWSVIRKSVFVGHSQPQEKGNPYALDSGPFNPATASELKCDTSASNVCESADNGVNFLLPAFPGQRLFNLYDGPAFQEFNAYLDINTTPITDCTPGPTGRCDGSAFPLSRNIGVLKDLTEIKAMTKKQCYLPNAAIAWKQPNGFYYPPAFNSRKLWFQNVDIRHFVVEPFFKTVGNDPFVEEQDRVKERYCTYTGDTFIGSGFNNIDRQTVLNDEDGSLTGLLGKGPGEVFRPTISINEDDYFTGPLITPECLSDKGVTPLNPDKRVFTARTSPYDWLSTVITADCGIQDGTKSGNLQQCQNDQNEVRWAHECTNPRCRGVLLYREDLTKGELGTLPQIRMMGQDAAQRSTLTLNHGSYYIDTTQNCTSQGACPVCTLNGAKNDCRFCKPGTTDCWEPGKEGDIDPKPLNPSVFLGGHTYYVFFIYATSKTKQTYDFYVGPNQKDKYEVHPVLADLPSKAYKFRTVDGGDWIKSEYQEGTGTVHVTLDLKNQETAFTNSKAAFCQPRSFCMPSGNSCVCKPGTACHDDAVCAWGNKDLDCPLDPADPGKMGCYGFSFTMPEKFEAPPTPIVPDTKNKLVTLFDLFESKDDYFDPNKVTFTNMGPDNKPFDSGLDCKYATVPAQLGEQ